MLILLVASFYFFGLPVQSSYRTGGMVRVPPTAKPNPNTSTSQPNSNPLHPLIAFPAEFLQGKLETYLHIISLLTFPAAFYISIS